MSEDEFKALLKLEGKTLRIDPLATTEPVYYIATVIDKTGKGNVRYAVGKTYRQTLKNIIKAYYADN